MSSALRQHLQTREVMNDFFVLTLCHFDIKVSFLDSFRSKPLTVWFVGGATSGMMQIAAVDTLTANQLVGLSEPTSYSVVPLSRALPASEIARRIIDRIVDEPVQELLSAIVEEQDEPVVVEMPRVRLGGLSGARWAA